MRSPTRGTASRERILQSAAEVAAVFGYQGTTIARVTARSGLPASSVYWFFRDKDELMAEVVMHSLYTWLVEDPEWSVVPPGEPMSPVLRQLLGKAFASLRDSPAFFRIGTMLSLETRAVESRARQRFLRIHAQITDRVTGWLTDALSRRGVQHPPELPRELAELVMLFVDGVFLAFRSGDEIDPDQFADFVLLMVEQAVADAEGGA
jgi:AcrR family transcriptional regulator